MQTQLKQVLYCPEMICRGQHNQGLISRLSKIYPGYLYMVGVTMVLHWNYETQLGSN